MMKYLLGSIIVAVATIIAAIITARGCHKPDLPLPPPPKPSPEFQASVRGIITTPEDDDSVLRVFDAKGTIVNLPVDFYLWLAVEHSNLSWPKGPIRITDTIWTGKVYEGGSPPDGHFSLSLYIVNYEGHQKIIKWVESGQKSGYYPGFVEIEGGKLLHSIDLKLKE